MRPLKPGDVVVGAFPGAQATKTRPAVVLSTEDYHRHRPDVVGGLITTQTPTPLTPTDCALRDWKQGAACGVVLQAVSGYSIPTRGPGDRKTLRRGLEVGSGLFQGWVWRRVGRARRLSVPGRASGGPGGYINPDQITRLSSSSGLENIPRSGPHFGR